MGEKAMKNTQAWGWLAAGVVALGLNGVYHDGGAAWAHRTAGQLINRIEQRAVPVLALATGRSDWLLANTERVTAKNEAVSCRVASSVARFKAALLQSSLLQRKMAEADSASFEAMMVREKMALARVEVDRERIEAQTARVRFAAPELSAVICPRVRVSIPQVRISVPEVRLQAVGAGSF